MYTDSRLYAKNDAEASAAYEDPKDSGPPQESIYELEPHSKAYPTSELVYEPVTESNIYSTPILPSKVRNYLFSGLTFTKIIFLFRNLHFVSYHLSM